MLEEGGGMGNRPEERGMLLDFLFVGRKREGRDLRRK
jgi:hypothetical protein